MVNSFRGEINSLSSEVCKLKNRNHKNTLFPAICIKSEEIIHDQLKLYTEKSTTV
jgi:hypothetical protein